MKEVVDVVDLHDNIVGQKDLSVALKEELLHRYVVVMVFNPRGELFVCKRNKKPFSGFYDGSVSGHVWGGEVAGVAALRLLHTKLGVHITPKHLNEIVRFGFHDENMRVLATLFAVRDYKDRIEYDKDEVKSGEFWSLDKVEEEVVKGELYFHPVFLKALETFKKMKVPTRDFL